MTATGTTKGSVIHASLGRIGWYYPPTAARRLLYGADPFLRVQPQVAVGDHAGGFLGRRLGLLDQVHGACGRSAHLSAGRVHAAVPRPSKPPGRGLICCQHDKGASDPELL
jgi:hypothetical protein